MGVRIFQDSGRIARTGFHDTSAIYHMIGAERIIEVSRLCTLILSSIASSPSGTAKMNARGSV